MNESSMESKVEKELTALTRELVVDYLRANPDFFAAHPELLETLTPPQQALGNNKVLDFQHYAIDHLQKGMAELKDQFHGLLGSARANMSTQQQVHCAVLELINARDLEQLLEILTTDCVALFGVDVIRIAIETDVAEFYAPYNARGGFSGLLFLPSGSIEAFFGTEKGVVLVEDQEQQPIEGVDSLFTDCQALMRSAALLRLHLDSLNKEMLLAFGVREPGAFHHDQGTELLGFLARVVECRLNQCMNEQEIEKLH